MCTIDNWQSCLNSHILFSLTLLAGNKKHRSKYLVSQVEQHLRKINTMCFETNTMKITQIVITLSKSFEISSVCWSFSGVESPWTTWISACEVLSKGSILTWVSNGTLNFFTSMTIWQSSSSSPTGSFGTTSSKLSQGSVFT